MIGEIFAIGSSVTGALGIIVSKKLTFRITALPFQTMRCWSGALFLLIVLFIMGRAGDLIRISRTSMGLMILSMVIGIALGDVIYLKALSLTEASKMFPVVRGSQVLSTRAIGSLLL